jgi:hypothetical protein
MIQRTFDKDSLVVGISEYLPWFDPETWISNPDNVCLINASKDICLFTYEKQGVYSGHYFFKSRGRNAINTAKCMLKEIFLGGYTVEVLLGLTPTDKLGAKWLSRQLGFTSYGELEINSSIYELFILTKKEYLSNG